MFGRNDFLGEVMMTLEDKVFDDPTPKWYNLQERVSSHIPHIKMYNSHKKYPMILKIEILC